MVVGVARLRQINHVRRGTYAKCWTAQRLWVDDDVTARRRWRGAVGKKQPWKKSRVSAVVGVVGILMPRKRFVARVVVRPQRECKVVGVNKKKLLRVVGHSMALGSWVSTRRSYRGSWTCEVVGINKARYCESWAVELGRSW